MTPVQKAREAFDKYAAMDAPELPENPISALQVKLVRWQTINFGVGSAELVTLGINEEIGELAEAIESALEPLESVILLMRIKRAAGKISHAVLKNSQKIRGLADPDKFRELAGDAIADVAVFEIQLCTILRLDYWTLLAHTAAKVMERDFTKKPADGVTK